MAKILVVDDEKSISDVIKFNLQKEGYDVVTADDGKVALELFESEEPDLILLDQMLPEIDGTEVLKTIRTKSNVPIIMVTAKDEEFDKVLGLELGADDYVTKPFSNRELISRVKARLRNVSNAGPISTLPTGQTEIKIENITIRPESFTLLKDDQEIDLTHREFELVVYLARHIGQVLTREALLSEVWGFDYYGDERTVDVTVRRLREKIEQDPSKPKIILTKRGIGYFIRNES